MANRTTGTHFWPISLGACASILLGMGVVGAGSDSLLSGREFSPLLDNPLLTDLLAARFAQALLAGACLWFFWRLQYRTVVTFSLVLALRAIVDGIGLIAGVEVFSRQNTGSNPILVAVPIVGLATWGVVFSIVRDRLRLNIVAAFLAGAALEAIAGPNDFSIVQQASTGLLYWTVSSSGGVGGYDLATFYLWTVPLREGIWAAGVVALALMPRATPSAQQRRPPNGRHGAGRLVRGSIHLVAVVALLILTMAFAVIDVRRTGLLYLAGCVSLAVMLAQWLIRYKGRRLEPRSWRVRDLLPVAIGAWVVTELALSVIVQLVTVPQSHCFGCLQLPSPFATYRITIQPVDPRASQFRLHFDLTYAAYRRADTSRPALLPDRVVTAAIGPGLATETLVLPGALSQPPAKAHLADGTPTTFQLCAANCPETVVTLLSFPAALPLTRYSLGPEAQAWRGAAPFDSGSKHIDANGQDISLVYVPYGPWDNLLRQPPADQLIGVTSMTDGLEVAIGVLLTPLIVGLPLTLVGFILGRSSKSATVQTGSGDRPARPTPDPAPRAAESPRRPLARTMADEIVEQLRGCNDLTDMELAARLGRPRDQVNRAARRLHKGGVVERTPRSDRSMVNHLK